MSRHPSTQDLENEVRALYRSDPSGAGTLIRKYLENRLGGLSSDERMALLDNLMTQFYRPGEKEGSKACDADRLSRLFSLLLGKRVSEVDASSPEAVDKLALAINTIFDALNQLMAVINATLLGRDSGFQVETLRHVIGSGIESENPSQSLETYLDQIKQAFLIAHRSFIAAAEMRVEEILAELDPEKILGETRGGLRMGPLRKADGFEAYESKFRTLKKWLDEGRFREALLREFENKCRLLYSPEGRVQ